MIGLKKRLGATMRERYRIIRAPRGYSVSFDLRDSVPALAPAVIFDVGANVGQSAELFLRAYPAAKIYCFEPVAASFHALRETLAEKGGQVELHQLAMGAERGQARIATSGTGTCATMMTPTTAGYQQSEEIRVDTLDTFCSDAGITRIDYLKIDTEGNDLNVLRGAEHLLGDGGATVVEVEAGMHPENRLHVPLEDLKAHLQEYGYRCFGIYEPVAEWTTGEPFLRRVNAVFIAPSLYNSGSP
ncbi:MAG: FkbM family methyltransferase [Solirubrobacteraceae bacterium]